MAHTLSRWFQGLFLILVVLCLSGSGTAADASLSAQVANVSDGEITRFDFDQFMFVSNSTTIDIEVRNTGSSRIKTNFTIEVFNDQDIRLYRYFIGPEHINPGAIRKEQIKHTANRNGTFIVRLAARLGDDQYRIARTLQAIEVPERQPANTTIVQREIEWIYPPESEPEEQRVRDWNVSYPQTINMTQGGTRTVPIRVSNTGEGPLRNVEFTLENPQGLKVSYQPLMVFNIDPGERKTFLLTLTAQNETLNEKTMIFSLESERLSTEGQIDVPIRPTRSIKQIREEIRNIEILISNLEGAIDSTEKEIDRAGVNKYVEDAYSAVNESQDALTERDIKSAQQKIEAARQYVDDGYNRLYQERQKDINPASNLLYNEGALLILALLTSGIMLSLFRYYRTEYRKRPELLRDEEE